MVYACWITHTHTHTSMHARTHAPMHMHSEYLILIIFPLQQWSRKRSSLSHLHTHCLSSCSLYNNCKITFKDQDLVDDRTLTLQHGVTSTGRHSENITCRGVTSSACHGARFHSFVYILTT